jgi:hypothetical protein
MSASAAPTTNEVLPGTSRPIAFSTADTGSDEVQFPGNRVCRCVGDGVGVADGVGLDPDGVAGADRVTVTVRRAPGSALVAHPAQPTSATQMRATGALRFNRLTLSTITPRVPTQLR